MQHVPSPAQQPLQQPAPNETAPLPAAGEVIEAQDVAPDAIVFAAGATAYYPSELL